MTLALLFLKENFNSYIYNQYCNALFTKVKIYIHEKYKLIK